jgi:hypothetical protein
MKTPPPDEPADETELMRESLRKLGIEPLSFWERALSNYARLHPDYPAAKLAQDLGISVAHVYRLRASVKAKLRRIRRRCSELL